MSASEPHMALVALASTGHPFWTIRSLPWASVPQSVPFSKGAAPLVTAANRLYMPFVGPVYRPGENDGVEVVTADGTPLRRLLPGWSGVIALAHDGTLYELGGNSQGQTVVQASGAGGAPRWSHGVVYDQWGDVLVGQSGTVYVSDGSGFGASDTGEVSACTLTGRRLWRLGPTAGVAALGERGDGTLLVADRSGLSAVSPQGVRLWRRTLGHPPALVAAQPSLAIDARGRAYVGSSDGMVRAVAPDGTLLWTLQAGGRTRQGDIPSLALGPGGALLVSGTDGRLQLYR
jgi:hypothetical protein